MPSLCVTLEKCPRKLKKTHPSASRASVTKRRTFSTSACRASSDARISTERFRFSVQWKIHAGCKLMGLKCYKKIGRMVNPCSYILSTYQLMKWIEKPLWWFLGCCEYLKQWLLWRQTDVIAAFRSILSQHWERIALDLHGTRLDYISAAKTSHQSLNLKYLAAFLSSLRLLQMVHRAVTRLKYCIFTLKFQLKHIKKNIPWFLQQISHKKTQLSHCAPWAFRTCMVASCWFWVAAAKGVIPWAFGWLTLAPTFSKYSKSSLRPYPAA